MLKAKRSGEFTKSLSDLEEELSVLVEEIIILFLKNPNDTRLNNHPLKRRMKGKWAFSITDDLRIIYEWISKDVIRFLAIGGHKKVYEKSP